MNKYLDKIASKIYLGNKVKYVTTFARRVADRGLGSAGKMGRDIRHAIQGPDFGESLRHGLTEMKGTRAYSRLANK